MTATLPPASPNSPPTDPHRRRKARRELAKSIAISVGIALVLRAFVAEAYVIPSESMEQTLLVGDQLFVDKAVYGLRVPFTRVHLTQGRMPRRGEVVVFFDVRDPNATPLIKRVVAIGGDTVEMRENRLYLNGKALSRRSLDQPCTARLRGGGPPQDLPCHGYEERAFASLHTPAQVYRVQQLVERQPDSFAARKVPAEHVFVLGDNRDASGDSRYFGVVPRRNLLGRALFIFWSRGDDGVRWRRIGHAIHR